MILRHIAWGRSDAEIADEMVLSLTTAAQQVSAIIDKIGVGRRAAVAAYAAAHGLLDQTPPRTWAGPAPERGSAVGAGKVAEPAADWGPTQSPVIILFTDMEGSTALIDRLGDARAQELLRAHNAIIRDCLRAHHGSEIQHTGDGLMLSFASAYGAIECAVAIQRALARRNKEHPETPIRVRIGMHAGEPIADKDQLFGAAVNAAARICARARGGQILVSDVIRQLAAGKSVAFSKCGRFALKGFSTRFLLHEVHWENEYA
jgi:class 3 adenylate cyclase